MGPASVKLVTPLRAIAPPANAINTYKTFPKLFINGNTILLNVSAFTTALAHSLFLSPKASMFLSS